MVKASGLPYDLIQWFYENKRWMPWRETKNPYYIWISEIMLQQTRVETVIDYYKRFIEKYPTVEALAMASEEEVLKSWEGLGYYSRGRNLQKAAKIVVSEHGGRLPKDHKALLKLPGIGDYTAGAIMSIAFNEPNPAVDGNVLRVFSRVYYIEKDIMEKSTVEEVRTMVKELMPENYCGDFSEALMELGALICIPQSPKCEACPVQSHCMAFREDKQHDLPIRISKVKSKTLQMAIVYGSKESHILVRKNPNEGLLAGLWVLPTYQLSNEAERVKDANELINASLPDITNLKYIGKATHQFTHQRWEISVFHGIYPQKQEVGEVEGFIWLEKDRIKDLALPTLYRKIIKMIHSSTDLNL